jgi:hypothetical protein
LPLINSTTSLTIKKEKKSFHPNFKLEMEMGQGDPYSAPLSQLLVPSMGSEKGSYQ